MVKGSDAEWDEGSAPEISVSAVIHAFPEELANVTGVGERFGRYLLVGEVEGQYFTAMEYLPGEDLCKVLNTLAVSRQHMPLQVAAGISHQLCNGLHFTHQFTDTDGEPLHLVHRDINPANVIITIAGKHIVRVVIDHRTITQQEIDTTGGDHGWRLFHGKLIPN